uniref:Uncharacterized protein n=1 Tax=Plectus sambesii TaxID=2011161 RepID=A0A914VY14_9BILA
MNRNCVGRRSSGLKAARAGGATNAPGSGVISASLDHPIEEAILGMLAANNRSYISGRLERAVVGRFGPRDHTDRSTCSSHPSSSMPRTSIFAAVAVAATVAMIRCCEGLACFENTEAPIGSAQIVLRNESSIKYCVAAPSSTFDWGSEARLFGINALEDRTDALAKGY